MDAFSNLSANDSHGVQLFGTEGRDPPRVWTPFGLQRSRSQPANGCKSLKSMVGPCRLELQTSTVSR